MGPNVFELGGTVDFLSFCPSRPRMCCLVHNPKQSELTVPNSLHSACPQEQDLDVPIFVKESLRSDPWEGRRSADYEGLIFGFLNPRAVQGP